jgi:hypothetical protein
MEPVIGRDMRKDCFVILLGILSIFLFTSTALPRAIPQNQNCCSNCESRERLVGFTQTKTLDACNRGFTPVKQVSASLQSSDLSGGAEVQAAVGSMSANSNPETGSAQPLRNPGPEGGNTPGPHLFLLIGLVLIGARLVISYRSRKLRNLTAETD